MAQIIWTEDGLADLREIAEYIAIDDADAADRLVQRVFKHVDHLEAHPRLGPVVQEIARSHCRQLVEPPCRVFYTIEGDKVYILHVLRFERLLRTSRLVFREDE